MKKRILGLCLCMILAAAGTCHAANEPIYFDDMTVHMCPVMNNLPTGITSETKVNNIVPLSEGENCISLSFSAVDDNDIYFVSVFDIDEGYITPVSGVPVTQDKFVIKGLTEGHNYHVRVSALLNEHTVSGTIQTGFKE
ncbi:MAG: fibronectin type III domain-containing protein [bacterium]|nr:fibronectin type III domain-containing protein [bacterium]